jgi:hypothetical protein
MLQLTPLTKTQQRGLLLAFVVIFLTLFASRIGRFNTLNLQKDEVWSVWQTLGTVQDTVNWTPYDWSPAYYLLVYGWRTLTGINPFTLRVMTALLMLLTAALLYRVGRRLIGGRGAILAVLTFGAFGYTLFISTLLRAYLLNVLLWLVALWISLIYFEQKQAKWYWPLLLALVLTAMFYIHVTAIYGIIALGLFTLVLYGWGALRRWIVPTILFAVLSLPEALNKLQIVGFKNDLVNKYIPYVPPHIRIGTLVVDFAGNQAVLWGALCLVAAALLVERFRVNRRMVGLLLWMAMPALLLYVTAFIDAYNARHLAWIMVGFALWIGWGVSLLPRTATAALAVVMALVMFDSIPLERYETIQRVPLVTAFGQLQQVARAGDALLVDPKCKGCAPVDPEEWDYFLRAYFPAGMPRITVELANPLRGYRRVWYAYAPDNADQGTVEQLEKFRAPGLAFGDKTLTFRLYEMPPEPVGTLFENGMRFHGAEILNGGGIPGVFHEGEIVKLRLFWSTERAQTLDYSVLTAQVDPKISGFRAQFDGPPAPLDGPKETSRWQPGKIYIEEREFRLSSPIPTGEQQIVLSVYQWWDSVRVKPITEREMPDNLLVIGTIFVKSL